MLPTLTNLRWLDLSGTRAASTGLKQVLTSCKYLETLVARGITIKETEFAQLPRGEALLLFDPAQYGGHAAAVVSTKEQLGIKGFATATDAWPTGVVPMEIQPNIGATPPTVIPALPSVAKTPPLHRLVRPSRPRPHRRPSPW